MASPTLTQRDNGPAPVLTTTFIPPPCCTEGHLTMLGRQSFFIWQNEPLPVPATTMDECYPKEFMTSYLDAFRGTTRPAFSPLVCPQNYQTISSQDIGKESPYIVCCLNNYKFAPPATPDPNRPGAGGTCYSDIVGTTVTKYDQDSLSGVIFFSTSGQAYAHPFDGFAYQGYQTTAIATSYLTSDFRISDTTLYKSTIPSNIPTSTTASSTDPSTGSITAAAITSPSSLPNPTDLTAGKLAGIVIGIIVGMAILTSALYFFIRHLRRTATSISDDSREVASNSDKNFPCLSSEDPTPHPIELYSHAEEPVPCELEASRSSHDYTGPRSTVYHEKYAHFDA